MKFLSPSCPFFPLSLSVDKVRGCCSQLSQSLWAAGHPVLPIQPRARWDHLNHRRRWWEAVWHHPQGQDATGGLPGPDGHSHPTLLLHRRSWEWTALIGPLYCIPALVMLIDNNVMFLYFLYATPSLQSCQRICILYLIIMHLAHLNSFVLYTIHLCVQ